MSGGVAGFEVVFLLLLAFVVIFAALARKLATPYPIVLLIAGLTLGVLPGVPTVALDPNLVFLVVLPPLLYAAAWQTSWREFRYNFVSIFLLAFGLVAFIVIAMSALAPRILPGFTWQAGFVLGAVVATTDAIAATAIGRRLGMPQRIMDILEGESLINDASGLLALEFGLALILEGREPTLFGGTWRLLYLTFAGLAVGLFIGFLLDWIERYIDDGPIEITMGVLIPYAAYFAAEEIHASGVLSVVACGLFLSRRSAQFFSPGVRLQAWAVWEALTFALNGLVFVLIGLQMPLVLQGLRGYRPSTLIVYGLVFSLLLIVLRLIWTFPGAHFANWIRRRFLNHNDPRPSFQSTFVIGWTGMRGVVALAAALALPVRLPDGTPFPHRDIILFLTFSAILVTLVGQGLTLPWLIRKLGLDGASGLNCEEQEARQLMMEAALRRAKEMKKTDSANFAPVYDDVVQHYELRLMALRDGLGDGDGEGAAQHTRQRYVVRQLLKVERDIAIELRNEGRINDEVLRQLEHELDLGEAKLHAGNGH